MEYSDLAPDADGYYRDNLLALCKALMILGDAPNTGDWFWELHDYLERTGGDAEAANVGPEQLALAIYHAANKVGVLEIMALIDDEKT